jgi:peptidoglycan/LPS O-acetylase OafA/YrhL
LKQFYLRRFKRLAPALAFVVITTLGLTAWFGSSAGNIQVNAAKTALGSVLLSANFIIADTTGGYFDAPAENNPLLHTWSLSVEEQFYVLFPIMLILGLLLVRRTKKAVALPSVVAAIGVLSFAAMLFGDKESILFGFYSPLPRAWEFVVGVLLAIGVHRLRGATLSASLLRVTSVAGPLGILLILISVFAINSSTEFPSLWTLLPVLGTGLLLFSGLNTDSKLTQVLSSRPFVKTGDWSYSIYLWHWPLIVIAGFVWPENSIVILFAAGLSVPLAAAAYRWVEQPLRKIELKRVTIIILAATCVALPAQAANAVDMGVASGWNNAALQEFREVTVEETYGEKYGCYQSLPRVDWSWRSDYCTLNPESTGSPIYLFGDSNANHFGSGVVAAGLELNRPVVMRTMQACALAHMAIRIEGHPNGTPNLDCIEFNKNLLIWLKTQKRGTVLLGFTDNYLLSKDFSFEDPLGEYPAHDGDDFSIISEAMELTANRITEMGHEVIFIEQIPVFSKPGTEQDLWRTMISECSLHSAHFKGGCIPYTRSSEEIDKYQGKAWKAVRNAAKNAGVATIDTREAICPVGTGCSTKKAGVWIYKDAIHLSVRGAETLKDTFVEALTKN